MGDLGGIRECCISGFAWEGKPTGRNDKIGGKDTYVTGNNPEVAALLLHDIFGWTFTNTRLLADHVAREANVTVYMADFFAGEILPADKILAKQWEGIDLHGFLGRNARDLREPEIFDCVRAMRSEKGHERIGVFGYCYGAWGALRLGAKEHAANPLVDCICAAQPSMVIEKDLDECSVPVQILAPEIDHQFTPEMKLHAFKVLQASGVHFDYQHFPGVEHGSLVRGDPNIKGEREAFVRAKNAVVGWFKQWLFVNETNQA